MRIRPLIALSLLVCPILGHAQSFDEYLKTRNKLGIKQSASAAALDSFVGAKTLEVKGIVKGVIGQVLVVENPLGGSELYVRSENIPGWLSGSGSTPVRMIIKANRETEQSLIDADLIIATAEQQMSSWEASMAPKPTAKPAPKEPVRGNNSRGGSVNREDSISVLSQRTNSRELSPEVRALVPVYANFIKKENRRLSNAKAVDIAEAILGFSVYYGVDARLIVALIICESSFNPNDVSHTGAVGLGQLMPGTARELGVTNAYDTDQNLYGTVKLLRQHLDKYSSQKGETFEAIVLALAAYNAGPGAVKKHGGVPPYRETQNYVRKVMATYKRLIGD